MEQLTQELLSSLIERFRVESTSATSAALKKEWLAKEGVIKGLFTQLKDVAPEAERICSTLQRAKTVGRGDSCNEGA